MITVGLLNQFDVQFGHLSVHVGKQCNLQR
jgi:hypothetical protein